MIEVSLPLPTVETFAYRFQGIPGQVAVGSRVVVPFGRRPMMGWVVSLESDFTGKAKDVIGVIESVWNLDGRFLDYVKKAAEYYFTSRAIFLDYALNPAAKSIKNLYMMKNERMVKMGSRPFGEIMDMSSAGPVKFFFKSRNEPGIYPGSELQCPDLKIPAYLVGYSRLAYYQTIIQPILESGGSVLVVVPDHLTARFWQKNMNQVDLYHSQMTIKEREKIWQEYVGGKTGVITGGILALLLPVANLGCLIIDRCGSAFYRRHEFSAFDLPFLARLRATTMNIPIIEGFSAFTPVSYSRRLPQNTLDQRGECQPSVEVIGLKPGERRIPDSLINVIKTEFQNKKKVLVIANRIQSHRYLFCEKCRRILICQRCSGYLESRDGRITCQSCGEESRGHDRQCPENMMVMIEDASLTSIKEAVMSFMTKEKLFSVTASEIDDVSVKPEKLGEYSVVLATPVVINPLFNGIFDCIIWLRPESVYNFEEFDAAENIYATISELKEMIRDFGKVVIFSTFHFHYALKYGGDEEQFFNRELKYRQWFLLPPFANVYRIEIRSDDLRTLAKKMREIRAKYQTSWPIKKSYLLSRIKKRGLYKGILIVHIDSKTMIESGFKSSKFINISLVMA